MRERERERESLGCYAVSTVFQLLNNDSSHIHVSWTIFKPVLNQSIILTLADRSWCYSHNPECQRGKPLLPILKSLVCGGLESNPRPERERVWDVMPYQQYFSY